MSSAAVVGLRRAGAAERLITKKELAAAVGRSERWVELRQREGLPVADTDRFGRRRYKLSDVQGWLHDMSERPKLTADERLAALEAEVRELRSRLDAAPALG